MASISGSDAALRSTRTLADMRSEFPDDADGDALRLVEENGADLSQPMSIDFSIAAPDMAAARNVAELVAEHGYMPRIWVDDDDGSVSVYCSRTMVATYDGVVAAQSELNLLCERLGAECDGWLTSGNKQEH